MIVRPFTRGPESTVLVVAASANPDVLTTIQKAGAQPAPVAAARDFDALHHTPHCSVAVVACDRSGECIGASLETIKRLTIAGFAVLAYGPHVSAWSLGERCSPLLAGCVSLLDSADQQFHRQLYDVLVDMLRSAGARAEDDGRLKRLMRSFGVVGESTSMLAVFRQIVRISTFSDLSTFITGETGTGKELIARACHAGDPKRSVGPFVAVNCSAISVTVAESELFGHRRGAFTGAERDRVGLIRAAHGGVLFLDEVGELAPSMQSKLLRVLQEGVVRPIGEEREIAVNVRVIAATNSDIRALVERKRFRADLFHRLNMLPIHLPPLRDRRADIAPLVDHFVAKYGTLNPKASQTVLPEFVEGLTTLDLPGNVRQVENIVRWALVQNTGVPLGLRDLPPDVLEKLALHDEPSSVAPVFESQAGVDAAEPAGGEWNLARSLRLHERRLLERALQAARGNHSRAARLLGITPRSVYNMVRRHRVS